MTGEFFQTKRHTYGTKLGYEKPFGWQMERLTLTSSNIWRFDEDNLLLY
jgi:hypothetical protein